jgi:LysR family transcriptional regulator, regulator for bpeEF and oprC
MDRLHAMKVFTRVVETNSFTHAADTLGLPRPSVTLMIQQLEQHLKVRLLNRTTRRVDVTPEGAGYYERCTRILTDIEEAEGAFGNAGRAPHGKLRVELPAALGSPVNRLRLRDFQKLYPEIDLMLRVEDGRSDLLQEGIDCAIRIGALDDSSRVARRVGSYQLVTVASPIYLQRCGTPQTIEDLENHVGINYSCNSFGRVMGMNFEVDGQAVKVRMKGSLSANTADAHLESALEGMGVVRTGRYLALPYLQSGRLTEILADYLPPPLPISTLYPHSRHLSLTVRVFVDWVAKIFSEGVLSTDFRAAGKGKSRAATKCTRDVAGNSVRSNRQGETAALES